MEDLGKRLRNIKELDYPTNIFYIKNIKIINIVFQENTTIIEIDKVKNIKPFSKLWYNGIIHHKIGDIINISYQIRRENVYAYPWIVSSELAK